MIVAALLGAVFFAAAAYLGILLGSAVVGEAKPQADGPPPGRAPYAMMIAGSALIGAIVTAHASSPAQLVLIAIVCVALAAAWTADAACGIVPDVFTLGPLGLMLLVALWQHQWWMLISAAIPFLPFAAAAALSRGRGMGWGDVKLAALGSAVLGAQTATLALAVACLAAVVVSYLRGRARGPIAFAPYMAAAIAVAIPIGVVL